LQRFSDARRAYDPRAWTPATLSYAFSASGISQPPYASAFDI
jgi:hypothetical protein